MALDHITSFFILGSLLHVPPSTCRSRLSSSNCHLLDCEVIEILVSFGTKRGREPVFPHVLGHHPPSLIKQLITSITSHESNCLDISMVAIHPTPPILYNHSAQTLTQLSQPDTGSCQVTRQLIRHQKVMAHLLLASQSLRLSAFPNPTRKSISRAPQHFRWAQMHKISLPSVPAGL